MQRTLWKGAISFGLVHIPVQMFSAEDKSRALDLTMLAGAGGRGACEGRQHRRPDGAAAG